MKSDRFLKVRERKELLKEIIQTPEDCDVVMRCLKQLIKLPNKKLTKLTLLDLSGDIKSMSLRWDHFIEQNEEFMEKNGIKKKEE
jgi:hypothetical protein